MKPLLPDLLDPTSGLYLYKEACYDILALADKQDVQLMLKLLAFEAAGDKFHLCIAPEAVFFVISIPYGRTASCTWLTPAKKRFIKDRLQYKFSTKVKRKLAKLVYRMPSLKDNFGQLWIGYVFAAAIAQYMLEFYPEEYVELAL